MAYHQARSGVCYAGAVLAGVSNRSLKLYIAGVDQTSKWRKEASRISQRLSGQWTATLAFVAGYTPAVGADVKIAYRTPDDYVFTGTILRRKAMQQVGRSPIWTCEATDYTWLLDRYALVTATYASCGINTAVGRILSSFTDGGFVTGNISQDLGSLDATGVDFRNSRVSSALDRLADIAGAYWWISPGDGSAKHINMATEVADGNAIVLTSSSDQWQLSYSEDLTQIRTKTVVEGVSVPAPIAAPAGSTTLAVPSADAYSASGGTVRVGSQIVTYTGVTTTTDPVTGESIAELTGLTLTADVPKGTPVVVVSETEDAAAVTALATVLGGGLSGVAVNFFADADAPTTAAASLSQIDVEQFQGASPLSALEWFTVSPFVLPGKWAGASITAPTSITGEFLIQSVDLSPRRDTDGDNFQRRVTAAQTNTDLADMIAATLVKTGVAR